MNADEVKQWLSEDEWIDAMPIPDERSHMRPLARTLAETRKALAQVMAAIDDNDWARCPVCDALAEDHGRGARRHDGACIVATMPRPR